MTLLMDTHGRLFCIKGKHQIFPIATLAASTARNHRFEKFAFVKVVSPSLGIIGSSWFLAQLKRLAREIFQNCSNHCQNFSDRLESKCCFFIEGMLWFFITKEKEIEYFFCEFD